MRLMLAVIRTGSIVVLMWWNLMSMAFSLSPGARRPAASHCAMRDLELVERTIGGVRVSILLPRVELRMLRYTRSRHGRITVQEEGSGLLSWQNLLRGNGPGEYLLSTGPATSSI